MEMCRKRAVGNRFCKHGMVETGFKFGGVLLLIPGPRINDATSAAIHTAEDAQSKPYWRAPFAACIVSGSRGVEIWEETWKCACEEIWEEPLVERRSG